MSLINPSQTEQTLRREVMEGGAGLDVDLATSLQNQINDLQFQITDQPNAPTPTRQGINNHVRNSDHKHSVNTWWETALSSTNKDHECANVYAYRPLAPVEVSDAAMTSGFPTINCTTSSPFNVGQNGTFAIIRGAGASGADLGGTITYVSPTQATLSVNASTNVSGARARFNLQKFTHKNTKNDVASVNDALKDAAHTNYGTNISDPDWKKANGIARIGGLNMVGYSLGHFASNGTTYVPLHQLESGREPYARFNLARANQYVKITGKMFIGIYNGHDLVLDWIRGSQFTLGATIEGNASTTVTAKYMVVLETSFGFRLVSAVKTVLNAPDEAAIGAGARTSLGWEYYAGTTKAIVYRQLGAGNVYKLQEFSTGANSYADINHPGRVDTGSASFPTFSDSSDKVPSYWATPDGELDDLSVNGAPDQFWKPIEVRLPFPPTVNMAQVFDPHLLIGLTEPLATELIDVVVNGVDDHLYSAAGQFVAGMIGKTYTLTNPDTGDDIKGTVAGITDEFELQIDTVPPWPLTENCILLIEDSQPHGLLFDLVGLSLNDGEWDFHPEDNSSERGQQMASNPNGSTQGGTSGQPPTQGGGSGGINCVVEDVMIPVRGSSLEDPVYIKAIEVNLTNRLWNGLGFEEDDYNEIEWIKVDYVDEITWVMTQSAKLPCTGVHRVCAEPESYRNGIKVLNLRRGKYVLISEGKNTRLETVSGLPRETGHFRVVSFGLKKTKKRTGHLFVANGVVSHNRKNDGPETGNQS